MSAKHDRARLTLAFFMMMQAGMSDASLGAILDSLQRHYSLSYSTVSLIFLVNVGGWAISTPFVPFLLHHLGMRATLILAALLQVIASVMMSITPPFGVVMTSLLLFGVGAGVIDATLSTYVARLRTERVMSFLYAFISVGAFISPLIIGGMLEARVKWTSYYFVPAGSAATSLALVWLLFGDYTEPSEELGVVDGKRISVGMQFRRGLFNGTILMGGLLTSLTLGIAELLSGWIVSYMASTRNGQESLMHHVLSGFWAGHTLGPGRLLLPFVPLSLRRSVPIYLVLTLGILFIVQFVPSIYGGAVAVAWVGFFIGPVTPAVLSIVCNHVPKFLLSSTVSIITSFGLIGSVLAPVLMGVASNAGGLQYLPAVLMVMTAVLLVLWVIAEIGWRKKDVAERSIVSEVE